MSVKFGEDKIGAYAQFGTGKKYYYSKDSETARDTAESKATSNSSTTPTQAIKLSDINADRTVMLFDVFYEDTAEKVVSDLLRLDQENKEDINILVNSLGGYTSSLWSIIDTMDSIDSNVNTICLGEADSCGAVLLAAGNKRYIGENSKAMIHSASGFGYGKESDLEQTLDLVKAENEKLIGRLAKDTDQDVTFLTDVMKGDVFLDSKESVEIGLVDAVLLNTEKDLEELGIKNMMFNSAKDVDSFVLNRLKKKIENKQTKSEGVKPVTLNEIMAKLKDFNIDLPAIQNENKNLAAQVGTLTAENESFKAKNEALSKEMDQIKAQKVEDEKQSIVDKLIENKKATQATIEAHKFVASKMDLDEFKNYVEKLPVLDIKESPIGATNTSENTDNTEREDVEVDKKVTAILKERGLEDTTENYMAVLSEIE